MKRLVAWFCLLGGFLVAGLVATARGSEKQDVQLEPYELVMLYRGTNPPKLSPEELAKLQAQHVAHQRRMAAAGKLVVAGPFKVESDQDPLRGLALYRVGSVAEARKLAEQDPAVKAGRLRVEVFTWYTEKGALAFPLAEKLRAASSVDAGSEEGSRRH